MFEKELAELTEWDKEILDNIQINKRLLKNSENYLLRAGYLSSIMYYELSRYYVTIFSRTIQEAAHNPLEQSEKQELHKAIETLRIELLSKIFEGVNDPKEFKTLTHIYSRLFLRYHCIFETSYTYTSKGE